MVDIPLKHVSGIYAFVHLGSGSLYIGQGFNCRRRFNEHLSRLRSKCHGNPHFQAAFNKYGEGQFVFVLMEKCPTTQLAEREQHWMDECRKRCEMYNVHPASKSPLGVKRSAETKAKIGAASKGRCLGRKHTPEELEKMSSSQKGRKRPPFSQQWRENLSASLRGRKGPVLSKESREKIASQLRGRPVPQERKDKIRATLKGRPLPKWTLAKRREKWMSSKRPDRQLCLPI